MELSFRCYHANPGQALKTHKSLIACMCLHHQKISYLMNDTDMFQHNHNKYWQNNTLNSNLEYYPIYSIPEGIQDKSHFHGHP